MIKKPKDIKILVVGDPGSIHAARFVNLLKELKYNVEMFHAEYLYKQDEHLKNTTIHVAFPYIKPINNNKIIGYKSIFNFIVEKTRRRFRFYYPFGIEQLFLYQQDNRGIHLARLILKENPDIIFSLKMQNEGYTVLKAKEILQKKFTPRWVHFSWGTDIELFGKDPKYQKIHLPSIKKILHECDYFLADSKRDVRQAGELGLKGKNLGFMLAHGGFDLKEFRKIRGKFHQRNFIIIKGGQGGHASRVFNILAAFRRIPELLRGYKIKVIYSSSNVWPVIEYVKRIDGLDYEVTGWLPYQNLLALYAQSRLAISATVVDGSPSFLLEAMALGAFPIHSDMESIRDWIEDGKNGLLFPIEDEDKLVIQIKKALQNDRLIKNAQKINWQIAQKRMDRKKIIKQMKNLIENIIMPQKK